MVWLDEGGSQRGLGLIPAPPAMGHLVEHFWIQKSMPKEVWRIVPDLSAYVVFSTTDGPHELRADCHIVGPRSTFFDLDARGRRLSIGVRLRPGVLPLLIKDSAAKFTNRRVRLDDIAGSSATRLLERMVEVSPRNAVDRLAQFLFERLPSVTATLNLDGVTSVCQLAEALQRNRRSAYNRFSTTVGLAPKLALRIHRLHQALLRVNRGYSFADAAASAGYSDQAHFSRETTRLLGEPPSVWRRRGNCSFVQDGKWSR